MRILVLMDNASGVSYHRLFTPYAKLQQDYNITVDVTQSPIDWVNIDYTLYDAVVFNRWLGRFQYNIVEKILAAGCKLVCDMDDYWVLPRSNPAYKMYEKLVKNCVKDMMGMADIITCSTQHLADKVHEFNTNTIVFPNCLDLSHSQWQLPKQKQDKLTIGWVGGISHLEDLKMLGDSVKRFCEDFDAEFYMAGYHSDAVEWHQCEKAVTGESIENRPKWFKTIVGTRADQYGQSYSLFDFVIAPLQKNNFNQYKSELKIIEAAGYNLPIVVSEVMPYTLHKDNKGVVFTENNPDKWYKSLMRCFYFIDELAPKNVEYCNIHHNLEKVNAKRYKMLVDLCS